MIVDGRCPGLTGNVDGLFDRTFAPGHRIEIMLDTECVLDAVGMDNGGLDAKHRDKGDAQGGDGLFPRIPWANAVIHGHITLAIQPRLAAQPPRRRSIGKKKQIVSFW